MFSQRVVPLARCKGTSLHEVVYAGVGLVKRHRSFHPLCRECVVIVSFYPRTTEEWERFADDLNNLLTWEVAGYAGMRLYLSKGKQEIWVHAFFQGLH